MIKQGTVLQTSVGQPRLFYIFPFTFEGSLAKKNAITLKQIAKKSYLIADAYVSYEAAPETEFMQMLAMVDEEVYSEDYRTVQSFYRLLISSWLLREGNHDIPVDIIVTFHDTGWGTVVFVCKFIEDFSYNDFMNLLRSIQTCQYPILCPVPTENNPSEADCTLQDLLSRCSFELHSKIIQFIQPKLSFHIGDAYPFIVLHSKSLNIIETKKFVQRNIRAMYGLANIDYWGWQRTKQDEAQKLLDIDLSRRGEYAFFITPHAAVEIDSLARINKVEEWAESTSTTAELTHLKVLFERVLALETLRTQHHLMIMLDRAISEQIKSRKTKYQAIADLRRQIADGLNDFYNFNSQDKGHVSGIAWISYGQKRMGIDRLHDSLKERIECLEMRYDILVKSASYKLTAVLSLISIALSASASVQIVNMIADIPIVQASDFSSWKWLASIILFLILILLSGGAFLLFNKFDRNYR